MAFKKKKKKLIDTDIERRLKIAKARVGKT